MKIRSVYLIASVSFVLLFAIELLSMTVMKVDAVGIPSGEAHEAVDMTDIHSLVPVSRSVVDMMADHLIEGPYAHLFSGSKTHRFVKSIILGKIKDHITDDVLTQSGLGVTEVGRAALAEEVYSIACIYYDGLHADGGSIEKAERSAVIEGIRYYLVIVGGYPEEEAIKLAVMEYDRSNDTDM